MIKQLFYYFYIDSYEFYEVYKIHLECLKTYINVFDNVNIILSLDDINNNELINVWKEYIQSYLSILNINFIIIQNNPKHREGGYFYNQILCKSENIDGLIFWGHGKRDFDFNTINVYDWICTIHYLNSFNINKLEEILSDESNEYCISGALLEKYNLSLNQLMYAGGMYWLYPKKLFKLKHDALNNYIYVMWFLSTNKDVFDNRILYSGEDWTIQCLNINNMHYFQKSLIDNIHYVINDTMVASRYDYLLDGINIVKDYIGDELFESIMNYSNKIINNVTNRFNI